MEKNLSERRAITKNNLGGYDLNSFYERLAVNYLEKILLESLQVVTYFNVEDKQPNYDGELYICNKTAEKSNKSDPLFRCAVQIKSINGDYKNRNKKKNTAYAYKYQCDTKIFNATLSRITVDPALLFLVDWKKKHIYWKYLSEEYCIKHFIKDKEKVTLFFSDDDEITDVGEWVELIINIRKKNLRNYADKDNQELLLLTKDDSIRQQAQKAIDYLNNIFENELKFIRDFFYPNVWKFGLSYADDKSWNKYGIYQIVFGDNNELIKKYEDDERGLQYSMFSAISGFDEIVRCFLKCCIDNYFERDKVLAHIPYLPTVVLQEILFDELDKKAFDNEKEKQHTIGDTIYYGIKDDEISIEDYKKMSIIEKTQVSDACVEELEKREVEELFRVWSRILYSTLGEFKEIEIDDFVSGEKKVIGSYDMITNVTYEIVEQENYNKLMKGKSEFISELLSRLDEKSKRMIDEKKLRQNIDCIRQDMGAGYSWYKLWAVCMQNFFLSYIKALDHPMIIAMDYFAKRW